jgi:hypothetical protein
MKRSDLLIGLAGAALGFTLLARRLVLGPTKGAAFEVLDGRFHDSYDRLRDAAARAAPVLVLSGDVLVFLDGDRRTEYPASAPATELIKAVAHGPVGIFAMLKEHTTSPEVPFDVLTGQRLAQMQRAQRQARTSLAELDEAARSDVAEVLEVSGAFLDRVAAQGRVSGLELSRFASGIGPLLLRLTEHATRLELAALHHAAEAALAELSRQERAQLEVVVAGAHQARARSLGLQYFQARFREEPGEERRVAYAESISDPLQARELVGTRRLDRAIAEAFFGDAKRLQRDVLGDAATHLLARLELQPIA